MRRVLSAVLSILIAFAVAAPLVAQGSPPQGSADQPYTVEYYYKVQWGHQQEFLDLFLKNHYPLLKKIQSTGRMLSIKIEAPAYHTTEDGRWDFRVTIRYKNSTVATTANSDEEALIKLCSGRTRIPTRRKSSADSKSSQVTGIYQSRILHRVRKSPSPSGCVVESTNPSARLQGTVGFALPEHPSCHRIVFASRRVGGRSRYQ